MTGRKKAEPKTGRDSEVVGQLTGGVLHEFNNVLQSIIGLAEMLDSDPSVPEKAKASMKAIQKLGVNATKIVQSIGEGESTRTLQEQAAPEHIADITAEVSEPPSKEQQSILLAEDDPMVLKVIASLLRHLGYNTLTARDGAEALEVFNEHPESIALVITDLAMPKMDGKQLAKELFSIDPNVKIVVMTGYLQEDAQVDVQNLRLVGWLEKPVSIRQLDKIIKQALASKTP